MPRYAVRATTSAPPDAVRRLPADGRSRPRWASGLDEPVEDRPTGLDPGGSDGVGAVRAFRSGRTVTGERITGLAENRRPAYEDVFNPALKDYRAVIELEPGTGGGTAITWRGTWRARPGLGRLPPLVLSGVMRRMAADPAAHASGAAHTR
ncbi:SRPBCC family protein [Nocardiopsis flavescens]